MGEILENIQPLEMNDAGKIIANRILLIRTPELHVILFDLREKSIFIYMHPIYRLLTKLIINVRATEPFREEIVPKIIIVVVIIVGDSNNCVMEGV